MKLFIVNASDYCAYSIFGIFDTREKAEFCLAEILREEGDCGFYLPNQFKIEEITLNGIYYTGFYSYIWNQKHNTPEKMEERRKKMKAEKDAINKNV